MTERRNITEGVYGPGTYTEQEFTPVPQDARRLLKHLAGITPGFSNEPKALDDVEFTGADFPILPGPIKAQVLVCHQPIPLKAVEVDQLAVGSHPGHDWDRV